MTKGSHIVSAFDDDLITVQAKISEMGGLVEILLSEALEALKNRDAKLAQAVIIKDKQLDAMELGLEELSTHISEMIYYVVKGEPLCDDRSKGEPIGLGVAPF